MIKYLTIGCSILLQSFLLYSQENESVLLESRSKSRQFYVQQNDSAAIVYEMGWHMDVGGSGPSIRSVDTLLKQSGERYVGKNNELFSRNQKTYLINSSKKSREFELSRPENMQEIHTVLNHAYYLDHFISMANSLNAKYPLNHYTFRNAFSTWKLVPEKQMDHPDFSHYADLLLNKIKDSITRMQDQYVTLAGQLKQNLKTISYSSLKDSLVLLPAGYRSTTWYFGSVVNEVSKQNPEYYFRLAEDLPQHRDIIFAAAENDKEVIQSLKEVENHASIKKEFFKDRKFNKTMPFKIIGAYLAFAGLITFLIVAQP